MKPSIYIGSILVIFTCCFASCKKATSDPGISNSNVGFPVNLKSIVFLNNDTGLCCGGSKNVSGDIFMTTNGGNSWSKVFSSNNLCINDIKTAGQKSLFAGGDSLSLYKSENRGKTWTKLTLPNLPYNQYMVPINSIYFKNENTGILAAGEHYGKGNISYSNNYSVIWSHTSLDNELNCIFATDTSTIYIGGYGIIKKSTNGGQSFTTLDIRGDWFISIFFTDKNTGFVCGYNGTIHKTTDAGSTWLKVYDGSSNFSTSENIKSIYFSSPSKGYAVGNNGLLLKTTNGGSKWEKAASFTTQDLNFITKHKVGSLIICGSNGNIFRVNE